MTYLYCFIYITVTNLSQILKTMHQNALQNEINQFLQSLYSQIKMSAQGDGPSDRLIHVIGLIR